MENQSNSYNKQDEKRKDLDILMRISWCFQQNKIPAESRHRKMAQNNLGQLALDKAQLFSTYRIYPDYLDTLLTKIVLKFEIVQSITSWCV